MEEKKDNQVVNYMFWTGGWDSTFMLIQELRKGKNIQPIYVEDNQRKSVPNEIDAIQKITNAIINRNCFGGNLLELRTVNKDKISSNPEITNAYNVIYSNTHLGSQHDWLSRYAIEENIEIMLGTENGSPETSHIIDALNKYCKLYKEDGVTKVDFNNSSKEGQLIFGKMLFPIIDLYETDMVELVKEWKVEDIMRQIWFCHTPINNAPCGICHPCEVKMESNMEFLLPTNAQKRFYTYKKINKCFGKRISQLYVKLIRRAIKLKNK